MPQAPMEQENILGGHIRPSLWQEAQDIPAKYLTDEIY